MKAKFPLFLTTLFLIFSTVVMIAQESDRIENLVDANSLNSTTNVDGSHSLGGDLTTSVPLTSANARSLSLPINLSYSAGIRVDQKASDVGLGWDMVIGSIKRDYGAFEPDYTATSGEIGMQNSEGLTFLSNGSESITHGAHNSELIVPYSTISGSTAQESPMNPDDYIVSLPNFSGSFWNSGPTGDDHEFVFSNFSNWKIDFEKKVFEVPQEVSRINEYNAYYYLQGLNSPTQSAGNLSNRSFANAICVPPYVHHKSFNTIVKGADARQSPTVYDLFVADQEYVTYEDFGKFILTAPDGTKYIFGKALRGQKYLFNEDPFWSTIDDFGQYNPSDVKGEFWKIDYVAEWVLTEIQSYDYIDLNGNGIADDADAGDWIRIDYSYHEQKEKVLSAQSSVQRKAAKHREWLNYTQTDRASSTMREKAYVKTITTPIRELGFETSQRFEVGHDYFDKPFNYNHDTAKYPYENLPYLSSGSSSDFDVKYELELQKYDKIIVKERMRDKSNYPSRNKVLHTVELQYAEKGSVEELAVSNYLIRNNNDEEDLHDYDQGFSFFDNHFYPNEDRSSAVFDIRDYHKAEGRGKTTLLGVSIYVGDDSGTQDKVEYDFDYANNPSFNEIHKRAIVNQLFSPMVRQSIGSSQPFDYWQKIKWHESLEDSYTMKYVEELKSILPFYGQQTSCAQTPNEVFDKLGGNTIPTLDDFTAGTSDYKYNDFYCNMLGYYYPHDEGNTGQTLAAWSLTGINKNNGYSITFEYEEDDALNAEGDFYDNLNSENVPVIKDYNDLARRRSIDQSALNIYTNLNQPDFHKDLYAEYHIADEPHLQGIRLKSKIISDGFNPDQHYEYDYGTIHYTGLPASFWQNYISGFSSFLSLENRIHWDEECEYSKGYEIYGEGWKSTDYSTYMTTTFANYRVHNSVKGHKYYDSVREIYPNGSSLESNYATYQDLDGQWLQLKNAQSLLPIKGFDGGSTTSKVYAFSEEDLGQAQPVLYKTEYFEANSAIPYQTEEFEYSGQELLYGNTLYSNDLEALRGRLYVCHTYRTESYFNDPVFQGLDGFLGEFIGGIEPALLLTDACFVTRDKILLFDFRLNYPRIEMPDGWATINFNGGESGEVGEPWVVDGGQIKKRVYNRNLLAQNSTLDNVQTRREFLYSNKNQVRTETNSGSSYSLGGSVYQDKLVTEYTYAHEIYGNNLIDRNIVSPVSKTNSYSGNLSNSNILSSSVNTWNVSGEIPRRQSSFSFKGDQSDQTGVLTGFSHFDFFGSNSSNWVEQGAYDLECNAFGQPHNQRNRRLYQSSVYGYGSGVIKADFTWDKEWFDATYSGFEDIDFDSRTIDMGSHPDAEHWYDENFNYAPDDYSSVVHQAFVRQSLVPSDVVCEGSYEVGPDWLEIPSYYVMLMDYNGHFESGDEVEFYHPYIDSEGNEQEQHISFMTISDINPYEWEKPFTWGDIFTSSLPTHPYLESENYENYNHFLCFEENPATSGEDYGWLDFSFARIRKTRAPLSRNSAPSEVDSRTGEYSYNLAFKQNESDTGEKTLIRPVRIAGSENSDCIENGATNQHRSAGECDTEYTASFWLKERPLYVDVNYGNLRTTSRAEEGSLDASIGNHDLKLIYEVWDENYTVMVESGEFYIQSLHEDWTYYETSFPVAKGFSIERRLKVYLENNMLEATESEDQTLILIDDLLIYPTGAKYSYSSKDNFGNNTDVTDMNNNTVVSLYDGFGRIIESRNADGQLVSQVDYAPAGIGTNRLNHIQQKTYLDFNYSETRIYTDGLGRVKQTIVNEPSKDIRTVLSTAEYNNMGWPVKEYKPFAKVGTNFLVPYENDFVALTNQVYNSSNAFTETQYKNRVSAQATEIFSPRYNNESPISLKTFYYGNLVPVEIDGKTYPINELRKTTVQDPLGAYTISYSDKWGRLLLKETPVGHDYTINDQGEITWNTDSEYEIAQTSLLYDNQGNLIKTVDPTELVTSYKYNSFGELVEETHSDKGTTKYKYNKWGELRFTQDAEEQAKIDASEFADLYTYFKYDVWGRQIESGLVKTPIGEAAGFTNATFVEDINHPYENTNGKEALSIWEYDGTRDKNSVNSLISETTIDHYSINREPVSASTMQYEYDTNSRLSKQNYFIEELGQTYIYEYDYDRIGNNTETRFIHPSNTEFNYTWKNEYDGLSRLVKSFSGKTGEQLQVDSENSYDVLGNLAKISISATGVEADPYRDYLSNTYDIRGQLQGQFSKNFKFGLRYDVQGRITEQYWRNNLLENTGAGHMYCYGYDPMNRLVNADYKSLTQNSWYGNYDAVAHESKPTITCEPYLLSEAKTAVLQVSNLIKDAEISGVVISPETRTKLTDAVGIMETELIENEAEFVNMTPTEQDQFLAGLFKTAQKQGVDLGELDRINNELEIKLNNTKTTSTKDQKDQNDTDREFTKSVLGAIKLITRYRCSINTEALAVVTSIPAPWQTTDFSQSSDYDCSYWYSKNGNFSELRRNDDTGSMHKQMYTYTPNTNLLGSVQWHGEGTTVGSSYSYDSNGNLTSDLKSQVNTINYSSFRNLPKTISKVDGTTESYQYNNSGNRSVKTLGNGDKEYFLGEIILDTNGDVERCNISNGYATFDASFDLQRNYSITDWLGTTRAVISETGTVTSARDHYPYGKIMPNRNTTSDPEDRRHQFTGHQFDEFSEYGYHGARYYNRDLGRYMSVDPLGAQRISLSAYNYVSGNPIMRIDPNGKLDGDYYDKDGNWLGNDGKNDDKVYTIEKETFDEVTSDDSILGSCWECLPDYATELSINHTEFETIAATLYSEMGYVNPNAEEAAAIFDVLENRQTSTSGNGKSIIELIQTGGVYGYGESSYDAAIAGRSLDPNVGYSLNKHTKARKGLIMGLTESKDHSGGAYFWEGNHYLENPKEYTRNMYNKYGHGTTKGSESKNITFEYTKKIGATTFMKYSSKLYSNKTWK